MTKKDYLILVAAMKPYVTLATRSQRDIVADLVCSVADGLARDNELFDRKKFLEACGLTV